MLAYSRHATGCFMIAITRLRPALTPRIVDSDTYGCGHRDIVSVVIM